MLYPLLPQVQVTRSGKFFHIDFGHFLGTSMAIKGFRRERAQGLGWLDKSLCAAIRHWEKLRNERWGKTYGEVTPSPATHHKRVRICND